MSDLLNPANLIVLTVIAVGSVFWTASHCRFDTRKSCCSDGASGKKAKKVVVADTDESHYPYREELLIGGMSCDARARNVTNALNALDGVWATVTYADHTARVRSKRPVDRDTRRDGSEGCGLLRYENVALPLRWVPASCHCDYRHPKICAKITFRCGKSGVW